MSEITQMKADEFMDMVHKIYALDDAKTMQGIANLMAVTKYIHNHLCLAAEKSGLAKIGGWTNAPCHMPIQKREMLYPALPATLEIPKSWTDGPAAEFDIPIDGVNSDQIMSKKIVVATGP